MDRRGLGAARIGQERDGHVRRAAAATAPRVVGERREDRHRLVGRERQRGPRPGSERACNGFGAASINRAKPFCTTAASAFSAYTVQVPSSAQLTA